MLRSRPLGLLVAPWILLLPSLASAHIRMDVPDARTTTDITLKQGPCGNETPDEPQVLDGWVAGATVTVEFVETINHPSHFRIALSRTGDDAFVDPTSIDDKTTDGNELEDNIPDNNTMNNGKISVEVTLPDEPCEHCVLQLIQSMHDKPATPFYYQCADIVIGEGANAGSGGGGSGGSATGGTTGSGGESASGGDEASGGAPSGSSGGASSGGAISAGGASVGGSVPNSTGGASGGGSSGGAAPASGGSEDPGDDSSAGGGCSVGLVAPGAPWAWLLAGLAGLGLNRVRRRASRT
jgi:hypothetical protein